MSHVAETAPFFAPPLDLDVNEHAIHSRHSAELGTGVLRFGLALRWPVARAQLVLSATVPASASLRLDLECPGPSSAAP